MWATTTPDFAGSVELANTIMAWPQFANIIIYIIGFLFGIIALKYVFSVFRH